jgi:hypothetical protein
MDGHQFGDVEFSVSAVSVAVELKLVRKAGQDVSKAECGSEKVCSLA